MNPPAEAAPASAPAPVKKRVAPANLEMPAIGRAQASVPSNASFLRFEFNDGKSSKFWSIRVSGMDVEVRYGRIGTEGQAQTKSFDTPDAAQKHAAKLIAEKTGKGYSETNY